MYLSIKKQYYDMIKSGEMKEEYFPTTEYYAARFRRHGIGTGEKFEVVFKNGFSNTCPTLKCLVSCRIDYGNPEWGALPDKLYYVLTIHETEDITCVD